MCICLCACSTGLCWLGVALGPAITLQKNDGRLAELATEMDGRWYASIVDDGYDYSPSERSNVAFSPAFPFLASASKSIFGLETNWALILTANVLFFFSVLAFDRYARARLDQPSEEIAAPTTFALLMLLFLPPTFFFRMGYSESTFLTGALLVLYGIRQRWPLVAVAALAGLVTATRPVGIAAVPVVTLYAIATCRSDSLWGALKRCAWSTSLACWGLIAFCVYQYARFGDAFAFIHAQQHWHLRKPLPPLEKLLAYLSWEPIRSVYDSHSIAYWVDDYFPVQAILSLQFANPLYFLAFAGMTVFGAARGWLNRYEAVLAAGLIAIPYVTRGYDMAMNSQARFAVVVFPVYLVLGRWLAALPRSVALAICAASAVMLFIYSAMFGANLRYF